MANVKLFLGSALLLSQLYVSTASAQTADPNAPLPPPPTYGDPQPVYQPPPASSQPYQPYQPAPAPAYGQPYQPYQPAPPPRVSVQPYQPVNASPYPYGRVVRYRPQFGIGLRGTGLYTDSALLSYGQGGVNLDFMLRVHPRITMELSVGYQRIDDEDAYYTSYLRTDVPLILGMRIHPGPVRWPVSPYFVIGAGADFASADLPGVGESTVLGEVQGGGGVEFRIGRHFEFSLDLRGFGRFRGRGSQAAYVTDIDGNQVAIIGNQGGIQFNAGLGVFF